MFKFYSLPYQHILSNFRIYHYLLVIIENIVETSFEFCERQKACPQTLANFFLFFAKSFLWKIEN